MNAAAAAKSLQSCPTLCDPIDGSPPGFPVPAILKARTLEWVAIFFSNARKWKVKVKSFSRVWLLATPWTAAYQAPQSMGFSRQEYWSGLPFTSLNWMLEKHLYHLRNRYISFLLDNNIIISNYSGLPRSLKPNVVLNSAKMISSTSLFCFKNYNEFPS